jgi:hypothetical protein
MGPKQTFTSFWRSLLCSFGETVGVMSKRRMLAWFLIYLVNATVPLLYYLNLIGGFGDGILMCLIFTQGTDVGFFLVSFSLILRECFVRFFISFNFLVIGSYVILFFEDLPILFFILKVLLSLFMSSTSCCISGK